MKALTLDQPWASLAILGYKPDETRKWRTSHRGPLAIHASANKTQAQRAACDNEHVRAFLDAAGLTFDTLPRGCFVGYVHVAEVVRTDVAKETRTPAQLATGDYGPHRWAWRLENVAPMANIACRGAQRIWSVPADLVQHFKIPALPTPAQ